MYTITFVCLALLWSASTATKVLINKCCPLSQQLEKFLTTCVDDKESESQSDFIGTQQVSELMAENESFLRWMDANTPVFDPRTLQPVDSFLSSQNEDYIVRYGETPSCFGKHAKYVDTRFHDTFRQLVNGTLLLNVSSSAGLDHSISLDPDEYCVDRLAKGVVVYITCPCEKVLCINKCCPKTKMFQVSENRTSISLKCTENDEQPTEIRIYHNTTHRATDDVQYTLIENRVPTCQAGYAAVLLNYNVDKEENPFWIFPNGSALVDNFGFGVPYTSDNYCVERTGFDNGSTRENLYFCSKLNDNKAERTEGWVFGSLFAVGSVFLAFTLFVYAVLPELRSSFHGKALMSHVSAILATFFVLAIGQLNSTHYKAMCYTLALVMQFASLAASFWLNVMCIDITRTFSTLRDNQVSRRQKNQKKFMYFSIYAWGSPLLISIATAILEFGEFVPEREFKPDFGVWSCWFYTQEAILAYFYGIKVALLLCNVLLFSFTAWRIWKLHRETAVLKNSESGRHGSGADSQDRFTIYLKLFSLMGLTWATEVVSWIENIVDVYYVTDVVYVLLSVVTFITACCKRNVMLSLRQRMEALFLRKDDGKKNSGAASNGTKLTNLGLPTGSRSKDKDRIFTFEPPSANPSAFSKVPVVSAESAETIVNRGGQSAATILR